MTQIATKVLVEHDGFLNISVGSSRKSKMWRNKRVGWSQLAARLANTKRTAETQSQYNKMTKEEQDNIKDVGGFVGGELEGERRTAMSVKSRQVVTLDVDYAGAGFWDSFLFMTEGDFACCMYSTHKHSKERPRYRVVIPLDRPVNPDEYQAISRKIAETVGIDLFDDTTYQAHRLMYWPSTSIDGEFVFKLHDEKWLKADAVLAEYDNWEDQSEWPLSSRVDKAITTNLKRQQDPTEKEGMVGVFCRTYSISEAIANFLPDVYEECGENRYTYKAGSSSGGAVCYEDKWLYSHHATDPCTMQLVNAFELVRIHKFGAEDEGKAAENGKQPSFKLMLDFVSKDAGVKVTLAKERMTEAGRDFENLGDDEKDMSWTAELMCKKNGGFQSTRYNIRKIIENDPVIKGCLGWDAFSQRICVLRKPGWRDEDDEDVFWNDSDDSQLRYMLETDYGIDNRGKIEDETLNVASMHSFHRVKDYLTRLEWDGTKRIETLFMDFLGAEDSEYVRIVTRKVLLAAVTRIMQPGCKFDNMLVLQGPQGIGKSHIFQLLGGDWFNDSLTSLQGSKESYEQLRGSWIFEVGELAALKKSEIESTKLFISKQVDSYRVAYGKRVSEFPRQCIFVGTTNEKDFLRDRTGNRRFWPVQVGVKKAKMDLWKDFTEDFRGQLWAEAYSYYKGGEELYIGKDMEKLAREAQEQHMEENPLAGMIAEFLEKPVPKNWYKLDINTRKEFCRGEGFEIDMEGAKLRSRVCVLEIWVECLGGDPKRFGLGDRKEIRDILNSLGDWKVYRDGTRNLSFGKEYGTQRAYVRIGAEDDTTEDRRGQHLLT